MKHQFMFQSCSTHHQPVELSEIPLGHFLGSQRNILKSNPAKSLKPPVDCEVDKKNEVK